MKVIVVDRVATKAAIRAELDRYRADLEAALLAVIDDGTDEGLARLTTDLADLTDLVRKICRRAGVG